MKKRILALALALLTLAGCTTVDSSVNEFNATAYVRGLLDETYTGRAEEVYLSLMEKDEEGVAETYQKSLQSEYENRFLRRFEVEDRYVSRELRQDFLDLLDEVYSHAAFSVKSAVKLDDTRYCVEVTLTPVTFFSAAYADGFARLVAKFEEEHPEPTEEELAELSAAQVTRREREEGEAWAQAVYDYLYPRLSAVTTGTAVTKLLLVSPNGQGYYTVSATDLQDLDDRILAY